MLREIMQEEDGAQVIEYSLILATLSIALVVGVETTTITSGFASLVESVSACFDGTCD